MFFSFLSGAVFLVYVGLCLFILLGGFQILDSFSGSVSCLFVNLGFLYVFFFVIFLLFRGHFVWFFWFWFLLVFFFQLVPLW